MPSALVRDLKALLDRLAEEAGFEENPVTEEGILRREAIGGFIAGGPQLLDAATPFLRAYYWSTAAEFTPRERIQYRIPEIAHFADIWEHVRFLRPPAWTLGGGPLMPGRSYLSFEGEVTWEPEHGLQLVFEDGVRLCKVSQYDGHVTVAHAYGDASLLGVVFG
jgi:uncharacterized protein DUF6985